VPPIPTLSVLRRYHVTPLTTIGNASNKCAKVVADVSAMIAESVF